MGAQLPRLGIYSRLGAAEVLVQEDATNCHVPIMAVPCQLQIQGKAPSSLKTSSYQGGQQHSSTERFKKDQGQNKLPNISTSWLL